MEQARHRHPVRYHVETFLTRVGFRLIPALPRPVVVGLARLFGAAGLFFSPSLRRIGRANLDLAFGDTRTAREKAAILRSSFQSFALVMLDAFWFSRRSGERIARHVSFDPAFEALFQSRAHLCVTAHYGNWEVMGMAVTARGYPLHSVAKPLKNPEADRLFIEARRQTGQQIVKREGAIRALFRVLQGGGKVALVLDQNTSEAEGGQFFPFFGRPVLVSTAPAALAIKTGADVFIGMMAADRAGHYHGLYGREIKVADYAGLEPGEAAGRLTGDITRMLEEFLREHPEHWLWTYKRWKYIPPGEDAAGYPFYARPVR